MADVSAALNPSSGVANGNLVAIAALANGSAAGAAAGAPASGEAGTSFGQHVIDSQAGAKVPVSTAQTASDVTVDGTAEAQTTAPAVQTVQLATLTPAPAVASVVLNGSAQDLAALSARMQKLTQLLQQQQPPLSLDTLTGSDGDAAQLSAALQKLGLSPADAAAQAGQITATLKAYKAKLGEAGVDTDKLSGAALGTTVGGSTLGQIAAMMMAGNPQVTALDSAATLSSEVTLTVNVTVANGPAAEGSTGGLGGGFAGTAQAMVAAFAQQAEVGRAMVGLGGTQASQAGSDGKELAAVASDEKTPITVELGQQAAATATDAAKDAATAAATVLPGAVAQNTPTAGKAEATKSAAASSRISGVAAATAQARAVSATTVLAPVKGEVLYKWQADASSGDASVTTTPAGHKQMAELVNTPTVAADSAAAAGTGGMLAVAGTDTPLAQFADKLATAMRSNVTEQASVQLQGLSQGLQDGTVGAAGTSGNADAGATGGQVRMLLNPPELGEIRIDLTVKDGSVHGTIAASDTAVVSLLAREVHTLKHGLDQAGLKLGEQGINLTLSNSNQQGNSQSQQQNSQAATTGSGSFGTELASDEMDGTENALGAVSNPANWVSPDRVVDVRV